MSHFSSRHLLIVIGRSPESTFNIPDSLISRKHAVFSRSTTPDKWIVKNLSLNGVFVNDQLVPKEEEKEVAVGDIIQFGRPANFVYRFGMKIIGASRAGSTTQSSKRLKLGDSGNDSQDVLTQEHASLEKRLQECDALKARLQEEQDSMQSSIRQQQEALEQKYKEDRDVLEQKYSAGALAQKFMLEEKEALAQELENQVRALQTQLDNQQHTLEERLKKEEEERRKISQEKEEVLKRLEEEKTKLEKKMQQERKHLQDQLKVTESYQEQLQKQFTQIGTCCPSSFIMGPKRVATTSHGNDIKKRKTISLETKYDIIKRSERGETNTDIGRALGLSRTTVQTIVKGKERVLDHVKGGDSMMTVTMKSISRLGKQHNTNIVEMEKLLTVWLEDQIQRNDPVSYGLIQEKAMELHRAVVLKRGESSGVEIFTASKGWFHRFKRRANLHNLKLQGEAASADQDATSRFPACLAKIIKDGGYTADQVFNVDETGLFWKRMPRRTYISKEEQIAPGHKFSKERLTLLLGSNASGDLKLKPLLVYLAENPRALKGIFKPQLPVIWKANKKAWVTVAVFEEWFNDHFLPVVDLFLKKKGLPFKVLLVLDNAPGHPGHLGEIYPNVQVVYLPPNTTPLLQPMDQGVIASFKAYYTRRTFRNVLKAVENTTRKLDVREVWKNYSILDAVRNIDYAWKEVKQSNLNGAWQKLCPDFVMNFPGFEKEDSLDSVTRKIVNYSKRLNLEVEADDVTELLQSHGEELSAEDFIELEQQMIEEDEAQPPVPRLLSATSLAHAVALIEQGLAIIEAQDPSLERSSSFQRKVQNAMTFYKETVKKKQMTKSIQSTLEVYGFKKRSPVPPLILDGDVVTTSDPSETVVPVSPAASPGSSCDPQNDNPSLNDPLASPHLSELPDLLPCVDPPASPTLSEFGRTLLIDEGSSGAESFEGFPKSPVASPFSPASDTVVPLSNPNSSAFSPYQCPLDFQPEADSSS